MAAYEKQQQQQQPQMSAPHYAHPVPPQPAYYAPPPPAPYAPRRSGPGCFLCLLFKVIAIVVLMLVGAGVVFWVVVRPGNVWATAVSAKLSRFDLADGPAGAGHVLQYNLTVDIRVLNPKGFRIHYDNVEARATYDGDRFGYDPLEPFYLEGRTKRERTVTAAFDGSAPVDGGGALLTYRRERSDGFYYVKVELYSDLGFKVLVFNARRKSKISCTLRLPVPNTSAAPVTTRLGTRCDVDF